MNTQPVIQSLENYHNSSVSENFSLEPTRITPSVLLDETRECLIIKGRSCPDNAQKFYNQINDSITNYLKKGTKHFIANFNLEYFNTSSSKCLFSLFDTLKTAKANGVDIDINWYYEEDDEDMLECGEDYAEMTEMEFNYIVVQ